MHIRSKLYTLDERWVWYISSMACLTCRTTSDCSCALESRVNITTYTMYLWSQSQWQYTQTVTYTTTLCFLFKLQSSLFHILSYTDFSMYESDTYIAIGVVTGTAGVLFVVVISISICIFVQRSKQKCMLVFQNNSKEFVGPHLCLK